MLRGSLSEVVTQRPLAAKGIIMLERLRMWYWQTLHQTVVNCCFKVTEVWAEALGTTEDSGRASREKPDGQRRDEGNS
jgi:hypothetical protein